MGRKEITKERRERNGEGRKGITQEKKERIRGRKERKEMTKGRKKKFKGRDGPRGEGRGQGKHQGKEGTDQGMEEKEKEWVSPDVLIVCTPLTSKISFNIPWEHHCNWQQTN